MRALLERRSLDDLTIDELRDELAVARDEDDRWEAKSGTLTAELVYKPVAGLSNRDGGLLVLGASRVAGAGWQLDGTTFPGGEPRQWVAQIIRDNLHPTPVYALADFEVTPGLTAVVVRVERHPDHLVVTNSGRVLRRDHGSTVAISDGSELTRLVRGRAGLGPALELDADLSADDLGAAALLVIDRGQESRLRPLISGLQARLVRDAQFEPDTTLQANLDRLSALAAVLVQSTPESALAMLAIEAHHRAVVAGAHLPRVPGGRPDLALFRGVLQNARALGSLLVRLELWPLVRMLVAHRAPERSDVYAGWMTYVDSQEAAALGAYAHGDTWRDRIRAARETGLRVAALHPDGADEHHILDGLLVFDVLANLIELDCAERVGVHGNVSPTFALFGERTIRAFVPRVLDEDALRGVLLPERRQRDVARLLLSLDAHARRAANANSTSWPGLADVATEQRLKQMVPSGP